MEQKAAVVPAGPYAHLSTHDLKERIRETGSRLTAKRAELAKLGRASPAEAAHGSPYEGVATGDIVRRTLEMGKELIEHELALARTELKVDVKNEIAMAKGLGVAGVCALLVVAMLLVTAAFAFAEGGVMPGWASSLVIAAVVLTIGTIAGLIGWGKRVRTPLQETRKSMKENVTWARERIA